MQKLILTLMGLCWALTLPAQNAFLQLYHPKNKEVKKLRTDSLHLLQEDGRTRRILYQYDGKGQLVVVEETERDPQSKLLLRSTQKYVYDGNNATTDTEIKNADGRVISKQRCTQVFRVDKQADSTLYWQWDSTSWQPIQKTKHAYNNKGSLVSVVEYRMDGASTSWMPIWGEWLEYDAQQRPTNRQYRTWAEASKDWVVENEYTTEYKNGNPTALTWRNRQNDELTNIERIETTFKGNGIRDSILTYGWNAGLSQWQRRGFTLAGTTDAAQLYETGEIYALDKDGTWGKTAMNTYSAGSGIYSDEPEGEFLQILDPTTGQWKPKQQKSTTYTDLLDEKRVYGRIDWEEANADGQWRKRLLAEGWFSKKDPERPPFGSEDRNGSEKQPSFSQDCAVPNPYVSGRTVTLPPGTVAGDYEVRVSSEDGRTVWRQVFSGDNAYINAELAPGLYIVSVSKGGMPVCAQKLLVN